LPLNIAGTPIKITAKASLGVKTSRKQAVELALLEDK
jgi:hypothetical protein